MLNLVANWRHVGRLSKLGYFVVNLSAAVTTVIMVLMYQPELSSHITKADMFVQLIQMQVLFNVPLLIVFNFSGLLRRTLVERHNDDE
jgi:hypothetical protein